jgi:hypothetical protein
MPSSLKIFALACHNPVYATAEVPEPDIACQQQVPVVSHSQCQRVLSAHTQSASSLQAKPILEWGEHTCT